MKGKIIHLYSEPMHLTSSYSRIKNLIETLKLKYTIESYFAIEEDLKYEQVKNEIFKKELLKTSIFKKKQYDILIIEGHIEPQKDYFKINSKIIKDFLYKGGIVLHLIDLVDLNSNSTTEINDFLKEFHFNIQTLERDYDIIIGFDKHYSFRNPKEFYIETGNKINYSRTSYPDIFKNINRIAVGDPINQKLDSFCKILLMGNSTTQLLSISDFFVNNEVLKFGIVNEKIGFYILITGNLFNDYLIRLVENDNLKFGEKMFEYFVKEQKERRKKLKMKENKCFLSHNKDDKEFAEKLGIDLIKNDIDVWFDKWEIYAGESITGKINEGLKDCNYFIIIMSPSSMNSNWVRDELGSALQRRINDNSIYIIPILLEKCEPHELLRDYRYIDFRKDYRIALKQLIQTINRTPLKPKKAIFSTYKNEAKEFEEDKKVIEKENILSLDPEQLIKRIEKKSEEQKEQEIKNNRIKESAKLGFFGLNVQNEDELNRFIKNSELLIMTFKKMNDRKGEAMSLNGIGKAFREIGNFDFALKYHEYALKICKDIDDKESVAHTLGNIGFAYKCKGELNKALEYLEKSLEMIHDFGFEDGKDILQKTISEIKRDADK